VTIVVPGSEGELVVIAKAWTWGLSVVRKARIAIANVCVGARHRRYLRLYFIGKLVKRGTGGS